MLTRADERLWGAWVPDPKDPDAAYRASIDFGRQGRLRFIVLASDGLHEYHHRYRFLEKGWLAIREEGRGWDRERYRIGSGDVLHFGTGRYIRSEDPVARPWPPEVSGEPPPP